MVIRVLAVPDYLSLSEFDEVFRTLLGWDGFGLIFHIHGQEFIRFLRRTKTQRTALRDFQLRPRETFLYTCGGLDLWEWEFRLLDGQVGTGMKRRYVGYWGATEQKTHLRESMGTPAQVETVIALLSGAHPDQPTSSWEVLREVMDEGMRSIEQRRR